MFNRWGIVSATRFVFIDDCYKRFSHREYVKKLINRQDDFCGLPLIFLSSKCKTNNSNPVYILALTHNKYDPKNA